MIYLDNNATTVMPAEVIQKINLWMNKGNPSADYKSANTCKDLMREFREYIATNCNFISYELEFEGKYTAAQLKKVYHIIFTSGASESNNTIIRSVVASYRYNTGKVPHIVVSAIEHLSLLECVKQLAQMGCVEVTFVRPDEFGFIDPKKVALAIKPHTCCVAVMVANNETGAINNIKAIGEIAHKAQVPFFTDAVQTFGKFLLDPVKSNVDAFSVSFHKLYGPPGIGLLVIKKQFIDGFKLLPEICGSQNCGFRGGTENIPAIAGAYCATKISWTNREEKNKKLAKLKKHFIDKLVSLTKCVSYLEYLEKPTAHDFCIVIISTNESTYLPNTIMLSVVKRTDPPMCNTKLKHTLAERGIIVSVGSACNTASKSASHVLTQMNVDDFIKKGALRITLCDNNTIEEMDIAAKSLVLSCEAIKTQLVDASV